MTNNPYLPPQSHVADALLQRAVLNRPKQVWTAVALLCLSLVLGVLTIAMQWKNLESIGPTSVWISVQVLAFSAFCWLYYKIWQGRNWARIAFLVLTITGLPFSVMQFPALLQRSLIGGLLAGIQVLISIIAVYLVFTGAGRFWFKFVEVQLNNSFDPDAGEDTRP